MEPQGFDELLMSEFSNAGIIVRVLIGLLLLLHFLGQGISTIKDNL